MQETRPDPVAVRVSYDGAGRVTRMRDANGTFTDLTYHPRGWLATRTVRANSDGTVNTGSDATTTITYDATGNVVRVAQPDGDFLRYWYDDANRLTSISDSDTAGAGNRIVYTLDAAGNRTKEETFDGSSTLRRRLARQYDALSQLRSLVNSPFAAQANLDDPSVKKTSFTYDPNGNQDLSTDPLGTVTDNDYDPLNRLIRTIGDKGTGAGDINASTQYTYDARDNLRTVVDPKGLTTTYTYDGLNNLTQLSSPDTGITTYGYDAAGNRLSQTDARGITASYTYDALNRLTAITYPDATLNVTFAYDQANGTTGCGSSFRLGRLTRITDASGTTTFCYDRRGNVTRKTQVVAGSTLVADMTYTRSDRLATLTYPGGGRARYGRDAQGRINRVWWRPSGTTTETTVVSAASYLPFGPLGSLTFGNGRTLAKAYDQNYWIDAVNGTPAGLSLDFGTDAVGNIVGLTVGAAANNRVYDYDDLNRLTSVVNGSAANVEAFTYDGTGNRLSKRVGSAAATPYTYPATSHRLQAVGGVTRSYDATGNTTQMPSAANAALTLVYDARNRLSRVDGSGGTVQANHYNGRGERVRKVAGALDRRFAYDESGRLLGEFDAGGAPLQLSVWMDDRPVAVVEGTALRYIETDHLNTPRALIDPARNVAVWRWDLQVSAFGEHAANEDPDADGSPVKFNLRFPGQYLDAETGLHYNYFRDYEAGTGRYVESDPIGLAGGIASYPYANSMPIGAADPRGEQAQLAWCLGGPGPCALAAGTVLACGAALQSQRFPQLDGVPEPSDPSTWRCEQPVCPPPPMTDPPNDDECVLWHARLKKNCQSLSGPSYAACITGAYGAFLLCVGLRSMSP
jgi:RHS repeat-associated protein